jgi:hypothetical protein
MRMNLRPSHDPLRATALAAVIFVASVLSTAEAVAAPGYCVRFARDGGTLDQAARTGLAAEAQRLNSEADDAIVVLGWGDAAGTLEYGTSIGLRRATVVQEALVAAGVAASRIAVEGRGKLPAELPGSVDPNDCAVVVRLSAPATCEPEPSEEAARGIAAALRDWRGDASTPPIVVIYDERHPLHGGFALEIASGGEAHYVAPLGPVRQTKPRVSAADFRRLLDLALQLEAWEQRAVWPPGPLYDFSFARLMLRIGGTKCLIREPYNDLARNGRMIRLRALMEEIALRR